MFKTATKLLTLALAMLMQTQNVASGKSHSTPGNCVWEKIWLCPAHVGQNVPQVQNRIGVEASAIAKPHQATHDGQWVTVESVTDLNEVATVYNLRVSEYHTYFVGSREWGFSVWAHNANYVLVPHGNGYRLAEQIGENAYRLVPDAANPGAIRLFANETLAREAVASGGGAIIAGPRSATAQALTNALQGYQSRRFTVGSHTFQLDRSGMAHILEGHHPNFFNGEFQTTQSFFSRSTSTSQIESLIGEVLTQNRARVIEIGAGRGPVRAVVAGVEYQVTLDAGRVVQFFPVIP